jgi:hypothetical protein
MAAAGRRRVTVAKIFSAIQWSRKVYSFHSTYLAALIFVKAI